MPGRVAWATRSAKATATKSPGASPHAPSLASDNQLRCADGATRAEEMLQVIREA